MKKLILLGMVLAGISSSVFAAEVDKPWYQRLMNTGNLLWCIENNPSTQLSFFMKPGVSVAEAQTKQRAAMVFCFRRLAENGAYHSDNYIHGVTLDYIAQNKASICAE